MRRIEPYDILRWQEKNSQWAKSDTHINHVIVDDEHGIAIWHQALPGGGNERFAMHVDDRGHPVWSRNMDNAPKWLLLHTHQRMPEPDFDLDDIHKAQEMIHE